MAYKNEMIHNKANPINFINEGRNDHSYTYDSKDNAYKKPLFSYNCTTSIKSMIFSYKI